MVWPMKTICLWNARYFGNAVNEHGGFFSVRLISRNSDTGMEGIEMIWEIENLFYLKMETLTCVDLSFVKQGLSDTGSEYVGHQFQSW